MNTLEFLKTCTFQGTVIANVFEFHTHAGYAIQLVPNDPLYILGYKAAHDIIAGKETFENHMHDKIKATYKNLFS